MTALNGRRAGRRQPSKIDTRSAANDAPEPDDPASAEALAARDRTGWPPHPSERRDFYHRIRVFPPEMAGWRKRMLREIAADPGRFPLAAGATPEDIQAR
jgi:hypothetical protein